MENKYYTPSLEEIHIGIECEFTTCEGAFKCNITDDIYTGELDIVQIQDLFDFYSRGVMDIEEMIRIKHLTQEDIETLGFKLKSRSIDDWYEANPLEMPESKIRDYFGHYAFKLFLNYGFRDSRLKIKADFTGEDWDKADSMFEGECKNKTELIKILKQIKVI